MAIVISPGSHPTRLTDNFLDGLKLLTSRILIPPKSQYPAYSPQHLLTFLHKQLYPVPSKRSTQPLFQQSLLMIGFSAGVVASIGAARQWHAQGGMIKALIAIDGWGVPLYGNFPIHRMSHDRWTHYSSHVFGGTGKSFYADPPVNHLDIWRSPHTTIGAIVPAPTCFSMSFPPSQSYTTTAASFLRSLLHQYGELDESIP